MSVFERLLLQFLFTLPGLIVCARLLRRVQQRGGRVSASSFALPDVLLAFSLSGFFALTALVAVLAPKTGGSVEVSVPTVGQLVANFALFIGFVAIIWSSLFWRKLSPIRLFGLHRLSAWRAVLIGALTIIAVFPLLIFVSGLMQTLLQEAAREQEVVTMFRKTQATGDYVLVSLIAFAAVVFQPFVEEFLFRGYFYGVFKGWAGPVSSAIFTATLFAAIHGSILALLPLLLLALILTLAYEWSGTLLVPVSMHMVFNGVQLAIMTFAPQWTSGH